MENKNAESQINRKKVEAEVILDDEDRTNDFLDEAEEKASALVHAGLLLKIESPSGSYYRKAG